MFDSAFLARMLTPRGRILLMLAAATLLAGLGREAIVAATQGVREFLRLPNDELAIAYGAYGFGLSLGLVLGGVLVELVGTGLGFLICGVVVTAATALTGFAWSLTILSISRLALGLAAGAMLPAAAAVLAPWTPPRERGWNMGVVHAALAGGAVLAWPLIGLAGLSGAWRLGFLGIAGLGTVWAVSWMLWFQARPGEAGDTDGRAALPVHWRGAWRILLLPTVLALLQGWGMALCRDWVPRYLLLTWHFDVKLSSWISAASGGAMVLGCLIGGVAADGSLNHSGNIRSAHQVVPGIGFLLAALSLMLLPIGENQLAIALWLSLALVGLQAAGIMLWVFAIDIGGKHTGIAAASIGLGMLVSTLISPLDLFGLSPSAPAVVTITALVLAGILSFWLRPHIELPVLLPPAPEEKPPEDEAAAEIDALLETPKKKARA
jgi:MFS family permease